MKEILVVSDSHHHNEILNQIFKAHPQIDTCIHCGDLQDSLSQLNIEHLKIVAGNNDFEKMDREAVFEIENYRFYLAHGHYHHIESGTSLLEKSAKEQNANIICFGHTHDPLFYKKDGIYFLNPGSVAFPRGGKVFVPTYAILTLDNAIQCHFYHAKTHENVDEKVFGSPKKKEKKSFFDRFKKRS